MAGFVFLHTLLPEPNDLRYPLAFNLLARGEVWFRSGRPALLLCWRGWLPHGHQIFGVCHKEATPIN